MTQGPNWDKYPNPASWYKQRLIFFDAEKGIKAREVRFLAGKWFDDRVLNGEAAPIGSSGRTYLDCPIAGLIQPLKLGIYP
jgi:hypothetical protein